MQKAEAMAADANLREIILNAIKDVEISISDLQSAKETEHALTITAISDKAYEMTNNGYKIGLNSQLDTLEAQKNYLNSQSQLISSKMDINLKTIKLYKNLGGGWEGF